MIRVLVVDDSPTSRSLIVAILANDPEIQIVGEACNGVEGVEKTALLRPHVVTMDLRMPLMDGFEATKEIMIATPTPIIIVTSSEAIGNVETSMHTLRAGALAVLAKPPGPGAPGFDDASRELIANVKALSQVKVVRHWRQRGVRAGPAQPAGAKRIKLVAMACSTGGPAALHHILAELPGNFPAPILVVQHITQGFTAGLADWLNKESDLRVKLAEQGENPVGHTVYLAADDRHLGLSPRGTLELVDLPLVGGFRPSATFLFESAARSYRNAAVGVILTGMGEDGVPGLRAMHEAGAKVLAQDEESSVIFGMPARAIEAGVVDEVLSLQAIASRLVELANP